MPTFVLLMCWFIGSYVKQPLRRVAAKLAFSDSTQFVHQIDFVSSDYESPRLDKRRISAASSASARLLIKVEAAGTPDWSAAEGGIPLKGDVAKRQGLGSLSPRKKGFDQSIKPLFVEMGGLEPPSKHRTRELSTRLVLLWFSTRSCRQTGYSRLIL